MKRKNFEDVSHDYFSCCPSTKSRRLDCETMLFMEEDPRAGVPELESVQKEMLLNQRSGGVSETDGTCLVDKWEERAIVLYQHLHTPYAKFPTSPGFPIVLDSAFIPGLKERLCWQANLQMENLMGNGVSTSQTTEPNNCLAVVPWAASQLSMSTSAGQPLELSEPEKAEDTEVEMMDMDDYRNCESPCKAFSFRRVEGTEGLHQLQHCLAPQFPRKSNNKSPSITW
ncbi:hypothetical protein K2173_020585 [Erythroxylum novogranatense]|uniref:Uncharacterized protein n=1 Tax=Erythroxylum novogranatense TaxID=1862640 RepID=A0AAV8TIW2_9ROSI|nr:hypothetical protein K2173_020585 [Erythroxylum novogranatense]